MPDWFYQPVYRPLVHRFLSAETARQLTMKTMAFQSSFALGRIFFDLLDKTSLPMAIQPEHRVELFGLSFPSPVGLASGIDIEGNAPPLWPILGLGFVQFGSIGAEASPAAPETEARLIPSLYTVLSSEASASVSASEVARRLHKSVPAHAPIGIALREDAIESLPILEAEADFFTIPHQLALDIEQLKAIRAISQKPLLLRMMLVENEGEIETVLENAVAAGLNGCIVFEGQRSPLLPCGLSHGAALREKALSWIRRISETYGDSFPVIGSGGILVPEDAIAFFEAGAKLIQLYEGLIYSGPGLPRRIIHAQQKPRLSEIPETLESDVAGWMSIVGRRLVLFVGFMLVLAGIFGIAVALSVQLLPYEWAYLGMDAQELGSHFDGRLAGFIFHDRIVYNGALISYGILNFWLAFAPLHPSRREAWAWWLLIISGTVGASSSLVAYLHSSYLDNFYAGSSLVLVIIFYIGLAMLFPAIRGKFALRKILKLEAKAWLWSPAGIGRLYLLFWALSTALGGFLIFSTGMSAIFVPEDHEFMQSSVESIEAISSNLIPFIAHDRLGFGVSLFAIGIAALGIVWKAIRPREKSVLLALTLTIITSHLTAVWVHPVVAYNSFSHLLPFLAKDIALFMALFYLYRPITQAKNCDRSFPDL